MLIDELKSMPLRTITILILLFAIVPAVSGGAVEPITGAAFDSLMAAQDTVHQRELAQSHADADGCFVLGPIDPRFDHESNLHHLFTSTRIVCRDDSAAQWVGYMLRHSEYSGSLNTPGWKPLFAPMPHADRFYRTWGPYRDSVVQLCTVQQNRYLIWLHRMVQDGWLGSDEAARSAYEGAVYQYLMSLDTDSVHTPPVATDFDLSAHFDLYAEPPDYVIQGYQNYKDFLHAHAELTTEFASGITAFVPTEKTLAWMKENAPREAHPNKEAAALQHEYRKFFGRGGDTRIMQTLTRDGFDTLVSGEYFFAVGLNGTIRFGRELLREEVVRIEKETGRKVPRANHAFLFPGEPLLTAGAFYIDQRAENKLVKVNAQSGHFFYSNISETIRDDIAIRSDHYLLTLGHFFIALDRLGIEYEGILVSKL